MCACSDFEAPAVVKEIKRQARKRHRCGECQGLIEPGQHYWENRGCWDGQWSTHKTCVSCHVVGRDLLDCFTLGDLKDFIAEEFDLWDRRNCRKPRDAYAGMLRRHRQAERTLRREAVA